MNSLGATVAALRHEHRITQTELARKSGVGVAYLSRLERNHITPSMRTLRCSIAFDSTVNSPRTITRTSASLGCNQPLDRSSFVSSSRSR